MHSTETIVKAQFYDIDPMNVVWHGNYPRFLEAARCQLLDAIGYNYRQMERSGFAWPVVDLRIKYVRPIRFGQEVAVQASIVEYRNRLKIDYRIFDRDSREVLTKATTIQVAVSLATGEMQFESPAALIEKMEDRP